MRDLRASVLKAFGDQLAAERARSEERLERAAAGGIDRAAYAREQRILKASSDLAGVSAERWQDLADWLDRFASGPDAPPVKLRPHDRKGSWTGAEGEAMRRAISELEAAESHVDAAFGITGLDVEQQSGRDMEGRLGRAFHEARYALEGVREGLDSAIGRIKDPSAGLDDPDTDDPQPFDIAERRPARGRQTASAASRSGSATGPAGLARPARPASAAVPPATVRGGQRRVRRPVPQKPCQGLA